MNRRSYLTVLVSLLTLGLAASVLANWQHAEKTDMQRTAKTDFMLFDSMDLLGSPVKDENGDVFGIVSDLKIDSRGKAIAIINHGDYDRFGDSGRFTPVPFDALEVSEDGWGKASVALKVDEKQLEAAPFFDPTKSSDQIYAAEIYSFYGIQPSWTEQAACPDWDKSTLGSSNLDFSSPGNSDLDLDFSSPESSEY